MATFPADHPLFQALAERQFTEPTEVQSAVLDAATQARDLLVSARTGSGKTVAYGLAIAATLLGDGPTLEPAAEPLALIIAPTRELALQVEAELTWLYRHVGGRVVSCVGGMDPRAEQRMLARGAHIVVGTPGRLRDHLERGRLKVGTLKAVVLDEADEMLDLGFREDLEAILETTPEQRRTLLFSATLPAAIVALAGRYQRDALRISAAAGPQGHADIEYRAVRVAADQVEATVVNLLRHAEAPVAIVFCNTREAVRSLHASLLERGFTAVALSGELGQNERNQALQSLRDGRARVCVATDVAARGIDLPALGLVIHAELPRNAETLQHRSGRTGRAGRKGISALLVPPSRRRRAEQLLQSAGVHAAWGAAPSAEDIRRLDRQRLLESLTPAEDVGEDDAAMIEALLTERAPREVAAALVRLYRAQLPAAEAVSDPGAAPAGHRQPRPAREPREDRRHDARPCAWFRLNIGRKKNADPRWLIPMICRHGAITKQEIGAIRIFEHETKFEIDAQVAENFSAAVAHIDRPDIRIERTAGPAPTGADRAAPAAAPRRPAKASASRPVPKDRWKAKPGRRADNRQK